MYAYVSSLNIFIRLSKSLIAREGITEFYHINRDFVREVRVRGKKEVVENETGKGMKEEEGERERERVTRGERIRVTKRARDAK